MKYIQTSLAALVGFVAGAAFVYWLETEQAQEQERPEFVMVAAPFKQLPGVWILNSKTGQVQWCNEDPDITTDPNMTMTSIRQSRRQCSLWSKAYSLEFDR